MDRPDDAAPERDVDNTTVEHETHATTGGAVAAGAVTGGVIGLTGGPVGAAIGAVGGALVAAAAERMMHSDDDSERARAEAQQPAPPPEPAERTSDLATDADDEVSAERQPG
jgi:hypothetical protein